MTILTNSNSYNTSVINLSIILASSSLSLSLKISYISKSLIRGIVSPNLICWLSLFLMPLLLASIKHAQVVVIILLLGEIMPSYSCYIKKGLICVVIIALTSY